MLYDLNRRDALHLTDLTLNQISVVDFRQKHNSVKIFVYDLPHNIFKKRIYRVRTKFCILNKQCTQFMIAYCITIIPVNSIRFNIQLSTCCEFYWAIFLINIQIYLIWFLLSQDEYYLKYFSLQTVSISCQVHCLSIIPIGKLCISHKKRIAKI